MSYLCAECHGDFHDKVADDAAYVVGDPWRRHPTDISLPNSTEYSVYGNYSLITPVGRATDGLLASSKSGVDESGTIEDIVICLSCHRAHGSNQPDLLRFDYDDMQAGNSDKSGGCFNCHTTKND